MSTDDIQQLFRTAAQDAHRPSALGSILLPPRRLAFFSVIAAILFVLMVIGFLAFGEYTARVSVSGTIQPDRGLVEVKSRTNGVIRQILVQEGDIVREKDELALVNGGRASPSGSVDAETNALSIRERGKWVASGLGAELDALDASAEGTRQQIASLGEEILSLRDEQAAATELLVISEENLARMGQLFREKHVSQFEVSVARREMLSARSSLASLRRQARRTEREREALVQVSHELAAKRSAVQAGHEARLAELSQEGIEADVAQSELLRAPTAGIITSLPYRSGQPIDAGSSFLAIQPSNAVLEAHLMVPTSALGRIQVGDRVELRLPAFPFERYGHQPGHIRQIARSPDILPNAGSTGGQPAAMYRVVVRLERQSVFVNGNEVRLVAGMEAEADILLDSRTIIQWVVEPLYKITKGI